MGHSATVTVDNGYAYFLYEDTMIGFVSEVTKLFSPAEINRHKSYIVEQFIAQAEGWA